MEDLMVIILRRTNTAFRHIHKYSITVDNNTGHQHDINSVSNETHSHTHTVTTNPTVQNTGTGTELRPANTKMIFLSTQNNGIKKLSNWNNFTFPKCTDRFDTKWVVTLRWISSVNRGGYGQLFSLIGETYGAGDTTTTFNVPNLQEWFIKSVDSSTMTSGEGVSVNSSVHLQNEQYTYDLQAQVTLISVHRFFRYWSF